jgi:hypothetical protein
MDLEDMEGRKHLTTIEMSLGSRVSFDRFFDEV